MIASFPMYDPPGGDPAWDALWHELRAALREKGIEAPKALTRPEDYIGHWDRRDHLITQVCGLPITTGRFGHLHVLGAPVNAPRDHPDPAPGHYYSLLIVGVDDPRAELREFNGARLAYNDPLSQSGWGAPARAAREAGIGFGSALQTGAHRNSVLAVARGEADIAAIDVVSWSGPVLDGVREGLRVIGRTPDTVAPPFVTSYPDLAPMIFAVFRAVLTAGLPDLRTRLSLGGEGIVPATRADYADLTVPSDPPPARGAGERAVGITAAVSVSGSEHT